MYLLLCTSSCMYVCTFSCVHLHVCTVCTYLLLCASSCMYVPSPVYIFMYVCMYLLLVGLRCIVLSGEEGRALVHCLCSQCLCQVCSSAAREDVCESFVSISYELLVMYRGGGCLLTIVQFFCHIYGKL